MTSNPEAGIGVCPGGHRRLVSSLADRLSCRTHGIDCAKGFFMRALKLRLKSSFIRDAYWALWHRERLEFLRHEVHFYASVLAGFERGALIFDIGANEGAKTDVFLRLGARVVAVEPDDTCSTGLEERFLKLRIRPRPVTIVTKAVSSTVGTEEMLVDGPGSAVNTMSPELGHTGQFNYTSGSIHGLALKEWVNSDDFSVVLERCSESSIEVFWKTYVD